MSLRRMRLAGSALLLLAALLLVIQVLPPARAAQDGDPSGEPVTPGESVPTGRVAGPTRIETAVAISQRAFPDGAATAYLAAAANTVDAVVAGSLTDGPILLVPDCALPDLVAAELTRLGPGEVIALGGTAAVCDDVLTAAGEAAAADGGAGPGDPDRPDHVITATAEVIDASSTPPFTVSATDPGIAYEGGTFEHAVSFTGTTGTAVLDDPRFTGVLRDGGGQLVVAGPGCGPTADGQDVSIACTEEFRYVEVTEGQETAIPVSLHTADEEVGETPLLPGTYVLDQPVRWEDDVTDPTEGEVAFDDGAAVIRVTYTVSAPGDGPDTPDEGAGTEVVEWETPEGTFRTTGHSATDLARIEAGVAAGEHIGIPNGAIHRGDGGVNVGHDWHLTDVEIVDVTMEVCDGTAAYVDAHLEDYLAIGRYCPWGAVPISITS